jgi:predicted nucleotidyltransferase
MCRPISKILWWNCNSCMNKIIEIKFGSHLYGTDTVNSDADYKGIYLPTARQIVLGQGRHSISTTKPKQEFEKNTKDDIDRETFSLKEYLKLLCEGQTVALDMLFSPKEFHVFKGERYDLFEKIYENKDKLIHKGLLAFFGYAAKQAGKYGIKGSRVRAVKEALEFFKSFSDYERLKDLNPSVDSFINKGIEFIEYVDILGPQEELVKHLQVCNRKFPLTNTVKNVRNALQHIYDEYGQRAKMAELNEGVDWKAVSHSCRVNSEGKELLTTGFITFPRPDKQLILDIKLGKLPYKQVAELIESGLKELEELQKTSNLRTEPDYQWAEDFVYDIYSEIVRKGS